MKFHGVALALVMGLAPYLTGQTAAQAPKPARIEKVAAALTPGTYSPTPPIADRDFWARVAKTETYRDEVAQAEELAKKTFEPLPDELYLEYSRNGNRNRYERVYFDKLATFRKLVVAECIENQGRFLPAIEALMASYAADKSWVLPAHDGDLKNFEGREISIDLFASEVACELATADYLLGDRLSAATRDKVRAEARRRIFEPYAKMMSDKSKLAWLKVTNNWNAVCLANVTGTALALLPEPQDKAFYVAAAEKYVANFLDGFTDDGYCSEGVGYWNYGFGCFVRLGHMLAGATNGQVDLFAEPKARSAGLFARRMEITPGIYPAFADCAVGAVPGHQIMRYVTRRYELPPTQWEQRAGVSMRWLDEFGVYSFLFDDAQAPRSLDAPAARDWFENAGILICRGAQTKSGLPIGVALKGGHNAEHHNHNDVGSYVYCIGDSMTLVDPGAEVYTKRTFSNRRYDSNVLNSFGHPVPRVAGQLQQTGRAAEARLMKLEQTDTRDTLQLDLTSAYPVPTLKQLTREFIFDRTDGSLTVTDRVEFTAPESFETAVITLDKWQQPAADRLQVGEGAAAVAIQIDAGGEPVKIESTTIEEDVKTRSKPQRIGIQLQQPVTQATVRLIIRPLE